MHGYQCLISTRWLLQATFPNTTCMDTHCDISTASSGLSTHWFLQAPTPNATCMGTHGHISHLQVVASPPADSCIHLHSPSHHTGDQWLPHSLVLAGTHTQYHLQGHSLSFTSHLHAVASPPAGSCRNPHPVPPAWALTVTCITPASSGISTHWFLQVPTPRTTCTDCLLHYTCKQWHLHPLVLGGTHTHLHRNSLSHHICKQWHLHSLELARTLLQYHLNGYSLSHRTCKQGHLHLLVLADSHTHYHLHRHSLSHHTCKQWHLDMLVPAGTHTHYHLHGHSVIYITPASSDISTSWFLHAPTLNVTPTGSGIHTHYHLQGHSPSLISQLQAEASPPTAGAYRHPHPLPSAWALTVLHYTSKQCHLHRISLGSRSCVWVIVMPTG